MVPLSTRTTKRRKAREVYQYDRTDIAQGEVVPGWFRPLLASENSTHALMLVATVVPRILARVPDESGDQVLFMGQRDVANLTGLHRETLFEGDHPVVTEANRLWPVHDAGRPAHLHGRGQAGGQRVAVGRRRTGSGPRSYDRSRSKVKVKPFNSSFNY